MQFPSFIASYRATFAALLPALILGCVSSQRIEPAAGGASAAKGSGTRYQYTPVLGAKREVCQALLRALEVSGQHPEDMVCQIPVDRSDLALSEPQWNKRGWIDLGESGAFETISDFIWDRVLDHRIIGDMQSFTTSREKMAPDGNLTTYFDIDNDGVADRLFTDRACLSARNGGPLLIMNNDGNAVDVVRSDALLQGVATSLAVVGACSLYPRGGIETPVNCRAADFYNNVGFEAFSFKGTSYVGVTLHQNDVQAVQAAYINRIDFFVFKMIGNEVEPICELNASP